MTPPNSSQGGENEGSGAAAEAATCSHPFGTKPASGLGAPRVDQAQHTPTPWEATERHDYCEIIGPREQSDWYGRKDVWAVAYADTDWPKAEQIANAAFIVRACNSHDDLVKALEGLVRQNFDFAGPVDCALHLWDDARAAIAKARSEQGA